MKSLTTNELSDIFNDDKDGEYIQVDEDTGKAGYMAGGCVMERIEPKYGSIWAGIEDWKKRHSFFLNVWSVNERGNVDLRDARGNSLGGLV